MPTKRHFENEFTSINGLDYKIEIWHKTDEVTDTVEIKSGAPGFTLNYRKLKDPILGGMMPSTLTFKYLVENSTDLTNAHNILTAQNENYFIRVYRKKATDSTYNIWWFGWVTSGFEGYANEPFPYVLEVKATCSLGKQLNKYNNQVDISGQSDYKDLTFPLESFEDNYNIDEIAPSSNLTFAWLTNWWNQNSGTPSATVNSLRKTFYNRAAFVTDPENFPLTIKHYVDEINGVLKTFMMRVVLSAGKYHTQQIGSLDVSSPNPIYSYTANAAAGEIVLTDSNYPDNLSNQIVIDNTVPPSDNNKGQILKGATFSVREEVKSVRAKYIFGNNFCNIPIGLDYTSGNVALGFVSQGTTGLKLFLNVVMRQTFPLTGSDAVTPADAQGSKMSGVLNITLKIGNKYLKRITSATNPTAFEWTTNVSTVDFFTGEGTYYSNTQNSLYESQNNVQQFLNQFGGDYIYPFTQWENDVPTSNKAQATSRFYVPGINLPDLGSTFGQVEFGINASNSYNLFWTPGIPLVSAETDLSDWISLYNPAASTNLDYNTDTNTPAASLTKTFDLGVVPYISDLTANEENSADEEASPIGAIYYASQTGNEQAPDIDLGDLFLGTNSSSNQINTLRAKDSSNNFIATGGFRYFDSGNYINVGQLLCNEYFKTKDEPVITLNAKIVSTSYEAHRTILYKDTIGGTNSRFVFAGGKFNPMTDTWSGVWYKLHLGTAPTEDTTTIFNPIIHTLPIPNNEISPIKSAFMTNNQILATTEEDIPPDYGINKVITSSTSSILKTNQRLIITDKTFRNFLEITCNERTVVRSNQVQFNSVIPKVKFPKGSYIILKPNDFSNATDISISGTPSNGDILIYDDTVDKFVNSSTYTGPDIPIGHLPTLTSTNISDFNTAVSANTNVTANTAKISYTDAALVASHTTSIATNSNDIDANETNIASNTSDISTNEAAIAANVISINNVSTKADNNESNLSVAETDISNLQSTVSTNTSNISTNTNDISDNATDIATIQSNEINTMSLIVTNVGNISNNATDISTNEAAIAANVTSINNVSTKADTNANDIDTNETNIASNTSNIATNASNISTNEDDISANGTSISTNTSNISTNTTNIASNTSNIATNTSNISTNEDDISANGTSISTNTSNISTNTTNIATLNSNISSNLTSISTNTTNIATNASDISSNTSNIETNESDINDNATAISTNTSNISTNTSNIATNTTGIATNANNIASHTTSIANNASNISNNSTNISTNQDSIDDNINAIALNTAKRTYPVADQNRLDAITDNLYKNSNVSTDDISDFESSVEDVPAVVANTAKDGITTTQANQITTNQSNISSANAVISNNVNNIDNKNTIFASTGAPTSIQIDDIWIDTSQTPNVIYRATSKNSTTSWTEVNNTKPAGSNHQIQFNNSGSLGAESSFTYNDTGNLLNADNIEGRILGDNTGFRTRWNSTSQELSYYVNPSDFNLASNPSVIINSKDGGSVKANAYDSRNPDIMAFVQLPVGYKITKLIIYSSNSSLDYYLEYGQIMNNSTVTSVAGPGTTNSTLTLQSDETVDERRYYILRVEYSSTTDQIRGAKITLEKV